MQSTDPSHQPPLQRDLALSPHASRELAGEAMVAQTAKPNRRAQNAKVECGVVVARDGNCMWVPRTSRPVGETYPRNALTGVLSRKILIRPLCVDKARFAGVFFMTALKTEAAQISLRTSPAASRI